MNQALRRRITSHTRDGGWEAAERALFGLRQLEVSWEAQTGTLWTFMRPHGRPSYNPAMLADFHAWQDGIQALFKGRESDIRYLVLGSRFPGVFNLGGDLDLFAEKIRQRDRETLVRYGRSCINILYRNMRALDLPMITIGLVQGDALGGGFESLLSFNVIVAERGVKFGLPETVFGLFPGMGAYSFLARRLGAARAEELIMSGRLCTAEEMYEMGIVHVLAEPGEGRQAVRSYIEKQSRRHGGHRAIYRAGRNVDPITLEELESIVEIWADAALELRDQDLKTMKRLVAAQDRLLGVPAVAAE
ncbi:crotonase/enoyl-CoA hydratase family protein [Chelatococcus albus]|uniref:crotonase/enoyl-CoA hydratase family protein n=1 Tax=Chelatococcus albus TaxID=3047466 RepID=UPI0024BD3D3B|nr:crotonase/enoyl-CoA hydratase family protein [Chelatococcus sp. SYSU_G07232]